MKFNTSIMIYVQNCIKLAIYWLKSSFQRGRLHGVRENNGSIMVNFISVHLFTKIIYVKFHQDNLKIVRLQGDMHGRTALN